MPRYQTSSGDIYNIPEDKVQSFLLKYPGAVLVQEQESVEVLDAEPGKIEGPVVETAVAGPMTEAQQQAVDTVSVLEDTSLELPEVDAFASLPTSPEIEVEDIVAAFQDRIDEHLEELKELFDND